MMQNSSSHLNKPQSPPLKLLKAPQKPEQVILRLIQAYQKLAHAEFSLFKNEMKTATQSATQNLLASFFFGVLATLAILPFMAFLVISLASYLNNNYALSGLILSMVFFSIGTLLSSIFMRRFIRTDFTLRNLRMPLQPDQIQTQLVAKKLKPQTSTHDQNHSIQKRVAS